MRATLLENGEAASRAPCASRAAKESVGTEWDEYHDNIRHGSLQGALNRQR
jgi:hypothetical protein